MIDETDIRSSISRRLAPSSIRGAIKKLLETDGLID